MKRIVALALLALVALTALYVSMLTPPASAEDGTTAQVLQPGSTQVLVGPQGDPIVIIVTGQDGHVTVTLNGDIDVTVNQVRARRGSWVEAPAPPTATPEPTPTKVPFVLPPDPAPAAAAPTGDRLWGSCTSGGQQFDLRWYGGRDNVLQFNHERDDLSRLNQLHKANSASCNLVPVPFSVRVEADARTFDLQPGQGWGFTWESGDFQVGFLARKR